ncbi:MAG: TonB-dependent receptor [Bacteroidia bacterium]
MLKYTLSFICFLACIQVDAQSVVYGKVYNDTSEGVYHVKITNSASGKSVYSDSTGAYRIDYIDEERNTLKFEHPNFKLYKSNIPNLFNNEDYHLDVYLSSSVVGFQGGGVKVGKEKEGTIEIKPLSTLPGSNEFSNFIKTLVGVSSNNELSSQYNVRGGSYDENLIYVNDVEVYRPQIVRSGQQEGLSFVNPDMVDNVNFSAGGFEARYGDKLSSVLDVSYRSPKSFASGVQVGILGSALFLEGVAKSKKRIGYKDSVRFSYLIGARYRGNKNLLNSLDAQGLYKSRFGDIQSLFTFHINRYNRIELLTNYAQNRFRFEPEYQETTFGTLQSALKLRIGLDGQEIVDYRSGMGALSYIYQKRKMSLKFIVSGFISNETEKYDIQGAYDISEIDNNLGSSSFGDAKSLLGVGYFINHARNELYFSVVNFAVKGGIKLSGIKSSQKTVDHLENARHPGKILYGVKYQLENIDDRFKEWKYSDSSGYNINPFNYSDTQINLVEFVNSKNTISNQRLSGYVQYHQGMGSVNQMTLTSGVRYLYSSLNGQSLISPRFQIYYEPNKKFNSKHRYDDSVPNKKNIVLKAAYGYYYQAPFYREMRNFAGELNTALKAQRSIHYTAGMEMGFKSFGRPFKFTAELYYKDLDYLVPYILDNVRIRYYATNSARGYAGGFDARINGEFIKGLESWFTVSLLKTDEKIRYVNSENKEIETEYLRRPTDRRLMTSVMFQDELKTNVDYRMHMVLSLGTGLPYYLGGEARYQEGNTIPAYKRVDIGFSKVLIGGQNTKIKSGVIKNMWLGVDVFNLLQINNVISYLWIKDFNNNTYGVPNYLTGRRLNVRLVTVFN